ERRRRDLRELLPRRVPGRRRRRHDGCRVRCRVPVRPAARCARSPRSPRSPCPSRRSPRMMLTPATQDYLKVVWAAREWDDDGPTTTALAARLGLSVSSVSEGVKRLAGQGLLEHAPYGSIELTDAGRAAALAVVRKHRVIETFLVDYLGYSWDEV